MIVNKIMDAHIHLDHYKDEEISAIMADLHRVNCTHLVSVSFNLASCVRNLELAEKYPEVRIAFGYHPEQLLPSDHDLADLLSFMEKNRDRMAAIGEVGLPYYLRTEKESPIQLEGYIELLGVFLQKANEWDKPVVLHAVYDDAPIVCSLLEKYNIRDAHFHWFKGDEATVERMINNGYFISITPDVLYEEEIQQLVNRYPLEKIMVETDGPWKFEGMFAKRMTHPNMIHHTIAQIAKIKDEALYTVYWKLYENTQSFYRI